MEPVEVVVKNTEKVIGYACSDCHLFHSATIYGCKWEEALRAAKRSADDCCNRQCACGEFIDNNRTCCDACKTNRDKARKDKAFANANKASSEDYSGWVYWGDDIGPNEGYFEDVEELFCWCVDNGIEPPEYVYQCEEEPFRIDAESIIDHALSDHPEGTYDRIKDKDIYRLQKYLDLWCKKQNIHSYAATTNVVIISSSDREKVLKEIKEQEPIDDHHEQGHQVGEVSGESQ